MAAVMKTPASVLTSLLEDVQYGADAERLQLEPEEVLAYSTDLVGDLADAICELPSKRLARLLPNVLGEISADQLIELRDVLRSMLIDINSSKVRQQVKRELDRR